MMASTVYEREIGVGETPGADVDLQRFVLGTSSVATLTVPPKREIARQNVPFIVDKENIKTLKLRKH